MPRFHQLTAPSLTHAWAPSPPLPQIEPAPGRRGRVVVYEFEPRPWPVKPAEGEEDMDEVLARTDARLLGVGVGAEDHRHSGKAIQADDDGKDVVLAVFRDAAAALDAAQLPGAMVGLRAGETVDEATSGGGGEADAQQDMHTTPRSLLQVGHLCTRHCCLSSEISLATPRFQQSASACHCQRACAKQPTGPYTRLFLHKNIVAVAGDGPLM